MCHRKTRSTYSCHYRISHNYGAVVGELLLPVFVEFWDNADRAYVQDIVSFRVNSTFFFYRAELFFLSAQELVGWWQRPSHEELEVTGEFPVSRSKTLFSLRYVLYAYWILPFSYAFWNLGHPTLNDLKRTQALGRPTGSEAPLRLRCASQALGRPTATDALQTGDASQALRRLSSS